MNNSQYRMEARSEHKQETTFISIDVRPEDPAVSAYLSASDRTMFVLPTVVWLRKFYDCLAPYGLLRVPSYRMSQLDMRRPNEFRRVWHSRLYLFTTRISVHTSHVSSAPRGTFAILPFLSRADHSFMISSSAQSNMRMKLPTSDLLPLSHQLGADQCASHQKANTIDGV